MLLGKMENHCGKNNQVSSVEHMEQHSLLARWGSGGLSCGHHHPRRMWAEHKNPGEQGQEQ